MKNLFSLYFFILGTIFASFFGLIIGRVPNNLSIIKPTSRCDRCGHVLNWYEKIPIISFIFLKGRCLKCSNKIGYFNFVYEIIGGLVLLIIYLRYGITIESILIMFINLLLLLLAGYDYKTQTILNANLWLLFCFSFLLLIYRTYFLNHSISVYITSAIVITIIFLLLKIVMDVALNKESIGSGDLYLLSIMGLIFNISDLIYAILVATILAIIISVFKIIKNKKDKYIAFGPYLCFGFFVMLLMQ